MRSVQHNTYGGPEVMRLSDAQVPELKPNDVSVEVAFAAINPVDWKVRRGGLKMITGKKFPRVVGCDFSGKVIAVGSGVTAYAPGDAVFGVAPVKTCGAFAEVVVAPQTVLGKVPAGLSLEAAAAIGTPGVTAWNALIDKAGLKSGQRVFINGCSGAVGMAAAQLALSIGAIVTGTASREAIPQVKALGVTTVLDYRDLNFTSLGRRFDVVLDASTTMDVATGMKLVYKDGKFLDLEPGPAKFIRAIFEKRLKPIICSPRPEMMGALAELAASGQISLPIAQVVSLDDAVAAITRIERGSGPRGKTLIRIKDAA